MIGGKLDLSQKIKIKVFIVFDLKEDTNIEESGKVILDLLSVIYDFEEKKKTFLSSFFHALKILSIRITKLKNNDILFFRLSPVHLEFPWNFIIPKQIAYFQFKVLVFLINIIDCKALACPETKQGYFLCLRFMMRNICCIEDTGSWF